MNDDDYELQPETAAILKRFEEGGEAFWQNNPAKIKRLVDDIGDLSNYHKGLVIIDLLVMLFTAMRALQEQQLPPLVVREEGEDGSGPDAERADDSPA